MGNLGGAGTAGCRRDGLLACWGGGVGGDRRWYRSSYLLEGISYISDL